MPRLSGEQAHLWRDIRAGIRAVDGLFRRLSQRVRALIDRYADTSLTHAVRRDILRQIDAILAPVFGMTKAAAQTAELTNLIVRMAANSSEGVWRRAYDRLASIVERRDPRFWQRIKLVSLTTPEPTGLASVVAMFEGRSTTAHRLRVERFFDADRRWVDGSRRTLSDRVWRHGRDVRRAIDDRLRLAIRKGEDPIRVAVELERYLNPEWQPLRYGADGRIVVDRSRKQVLTLKPRGGHGSNAARRLARTEIIGAHGRATVASAKVIPGVIGAKWNLSASHPEPDECDDKARGHSDGLPPGVYLPDEFPSYPSHPQDICFITHEHMSRADLIDQLVQQYGGAA